ncbi:hypothetical protein [Burkholderia pseudomallei]|uniref:hypothetical protein n=1 Tax=Burkholderia pseudomallei TaxID=28450 RepID=UPI0005E6A143|nr:hypothetical protein [Burkholderia pseudomallei]MDV2160728.1 hypothetical protein [Burkholderia pseudomallei]MDV2234262.1 hypothetical protein [Burkholderia pseudomallei]QGS82511.1 hypothetical protein PMC2000_29250 [Burkholderia pseudomallei]QUN94014.1 hypothetical protein KEX44_07805 [Burkholderia pseudomallei]CAK1281944.1 Uncharacterised protein [Burkholderia pseudomallei]
MNCKPGDLAYVTGSGIPEQNGMVVKVEEAGANGPSWWVVSFRGAVQTRTGRVAFGRAQVLDANLRPISGVPVSDDVYNEVPA